MGFLSWLSAKRLPQVVMYGAKNLDGLGEEDRAEYACQVERVLSSGIGPCLWHDWREVYPVDMGLRGWETRYGKAFEFDLDLEKIRKPYLCRRCGAECVLLFTSPVGPTDT